MLELRPGCCGGNLVARPVRPPALLEKDPPRATRVVDPALRAGG